ncbi:MAG: DMT family transporter [Anaerolineae bacterium]|nr:DMT family transporter [Anaerolineae bacterium]
MTRANTIQNGRLAGINAALVSAFFLGLAPVFGKAAMGGDHFSPFTVVALRTGAAALLLFLIMAIFKRKFLYIYGTGLLGCFIAGSINGIGSLFYYVGLSRLNASVAQMLYALYPFFVAIWLILDRQPLSRLTLIRIVIAFLSAILLTQSNAGTTDLFGVACMIIAAGFYAAHIPINQRVLYDVPAPTVTLYTLISMSAIVISAYSIFDRSIPTLEEGTPWLAVFGLTMVTFLSRLMLFLGIKHIGGMQTALLGLGELIVAILFSHLLLNEMLTRLQWVGVACLGISLLLVLLEKPAPHPPTHPHGLLSWLQPPDFPDDFYKH